MMVLVFTRIILQGGVCQKLVHPYKYGRADFYG